MIDIGARPNTMENLTSEQYRKVRRGLLMVFFGLLYFSLVVNLVLAFFTLPSPYIGAGIDLAGAALLIAGLATLVGLPIRPPYRKQLLISMAFIAVTTAVGFLSVFVDLPVALTGTADMGIGFSALFFVMALQGLVEQVNWVGVRKLLRKDVLFVSVFWLGSDALLLAMLLGLPLLQAVLFGILAVGILKLVAATHLWLTVTEIHRTARLRQNVEARKRRSRRRNPGVAGAGPNQSR